MDERGIHAASAHMEESGGGDLLMEPGSVRLYRFSFRPLQEDVSGQIEVGWTLFDLHDCPRMTDLFSMSVGGRMSVWLSLKFMRTVLWIYVSPLHSYL